MLYGPDGKVIASTNFKKANGPTYVGQGPGNWAGRDAEFFTLPGGGIVQFNLNNLTLQDYRVMRDHYQVNASQSVLAFMLHQADWSIQCDDEKIASHCTANLLNLWTRLVRAISQSFWAGFSPNTLEWENDSNSRTLQLNKIKDLLPEDCKVNWKKIDVPIPNQDNGGVQYGHIRVYDGIRQVGWPKPIPTENTFWYPLLMENGNYYGRKLLRSAYVSWFFSILVHLFSNRYFERFGEPVPVGRAPYEQEVEVDGKQVRGNVLMETVLTQLRNRSVVVLPNDRQTYGNETASHPDYEIEYLESQMRGADFERYLTRLDEEISLALFTPLLILRTAEVGSYNLGIGHMQMYLWMLNALLGDMKEYIDRYILSPMVNYNFSPNAPRAKIVFRKLGKENVETIRAVITELTRQGRIKVNLDELGQMTGMSLEEVEVVTEPPSGSQNDPSPDQRGPRNKPKTSAPRGTGKDRATAKSISNRLSQQVERAFSDGTFGNRFTPRMGYRRAMEEALAERYGDRALAMNERLYSRMDRWMSEVISLGKEEFSTPVEFMDLFERMLDSQLSDISNA